MKRQFLIFLCISSVFTLFAQEIEQNSGILMYQYKMFTGNKYISLNGEESYKYSDLFGPSSELINKISINQDIISDLNISKRNAKIGSSLYIPGLALLFADIIVLINNPALFQDNHNGKTIFWGIYTGGLVISFSSFPFIYNAFNNTNRAVTKYNAIVNNN